MTVAVVAHVRHVVLAILLDAERRGPAQKAVAVDEVLVGFGVAVVHERQLRGKAQHGKVLPVNIEDEHIVVAEVGADVVKPAVAVFLQAAKQADIVLPAIVVARTEEANTDRTVLEQEAAKIRCDRLDADPQAVEVVAVRDVAQVLVEEQSLDADEVVVTRRALARVGFENAGLANLHPCEVEHRQKAQFVVGRFEYSFAFVEYGLQKHVLSERCLLRIAEYIERTGLRGVGDGDGCRQAAVLESRIRDQVQCEKPVATKCRPIAFQYIVAVVGVPGTLGVADSIHDAPAIGYRGEVGQLTPHGGRQPGLVAAMSFPRRIAGASSQSL